MTEYKNWVLSGDHSVATGDVFCTYLNRGIKKLDNMTPNASKVRFEAIYKQYIDLKADNKLPIG